MTDCAIGQLLDISPQLAPPEPARPAVPVEQAQNTDQGSAVGCHLDDDDLEVAALMGGDEALTGGGEANASADELTLHLATDLQDLSIEHGRMEYVPEARLPSGDAWLYEEVKLLDDEEFDFDFPLSPNSSKAGEEPADLEDIGDGDDEIFFGSMGFSEQCVSKAVEITEHEEEVLKPLSPLSAKEWVEIFKEAQMVAIRLKKANHSSSSSVSSTSETNNEISTIMASMPVLSPNTEALAASIRDQIHNERTPNNTPPPVNSGTVTKKKDTDTVTKSKNLDTVTKKKNSDTAIKENISNTLIKNQENKENEPASRISFVQKRLFGLKPNGKGPLEELATVIPRVQMDKMIEFSAKASQEQGSTKVAKMRRSLQQPSKLQKPSTGLVRQASFKSRLQVPTAVGKKRLSPVKRRRLNSVESVDDETMSIASDSSEASDICPPAKRSLPQPRLKMPGQLSVGSQKPLSRLQAPSGPHLSSSVSHSSREQRINPAAPTSQLPSVRSLDPPAVRTTRAQSQIAKPALTGATTKLEMMRPGAVPRKPLTVNRSKLLKPGPGVVPASAGPLKAVAVVEPKVSPQLDPPATQAMKCKLSASSHNLMTPTKQDKWVKPKRLMAVDTASSPRRNSDSSVPDAGTPASTAKAHHRRSFLPTPGKQRSSSCSSAATRSSVSSIDSGVDSPAAALRVNVNEYSTPGMMVPRKPKIQHTPLDPADMPAQKLSIWSPIRRPKALNKEDEAIQCTKRTTITRL